MENVMNIAAQMDAERINGVVNNEGTTIYQFNANDLFDWTDAVPFEVEDENAEEVIQTKGKKIVLTGADILEDFNVEIALTGEDKTALELHWIAMSAMSEIYDAEIAEFRNFTATEVEVNGETISAIWSA